MMKCNITTSEKTVSVVSDYNRKFVAAAKRCGGKWNEPAWVFDVRDIDDVRAMCREHYGFDDQSPPELVDIEIYWENAARVYTAPITYGGIQIARAYGRDSGAKMADGVKIIDGGFSSGGSMKNWTTTCQPGTRVLIRDVPRAIFIAESDDADNDFTAKIVSEQPTNNTALQAEREKLMARIAEIDNILEGN